MSGLIAIDLNPISWITDAAGAVVDTVASSVLEGIVSAIEDGMRYVANAIADELTGLAAVDLGSSTAQQMGGVFKWVAMAVAVGSIMASAVMAAVSPQGSLGDTLREIPITLVLMAGWFGLMTVWVEAIGALMSVWTTEALVDGLASQIVLDSTIALFVRGLVALLLIILLIIFFIELLVLNHMLTFGVLIGQVAIAMRPVRALRDVSGRMVRNLVSLSITPALGVASLALSVGRLNEATELTFGRALGALAGLVVSVLMPLVVAKFLPLGGQIGSPGRSMIAAGAQIAGTAALAAGGASALAAGGGLSSFVSSGAAPSSSGGQPGGSPPPLGGSGGSGSAGSGPPTGGGPSTSSGGSWTSSAGLPSDGSSPAPAAAAGKARTTRPATVAMTVSQLFDRGAREQ